MTTYFISLSSSYRFSCRKRSFSSTWPLTSTATVNEITIDDFARSNSAIVTRYVITVVDLIGCHKFFTNEKLLITLEACGFGLDFVQLESEVVASISLSFSTSKWCR